MQLTPEQSAASRDQLYLSACEGGKLNAHETTLTTSRRRGGGTMLILQVDGQDMRALDRAAGLLDSLGRNEDHPILQQSRLPFLSNNWLSLKL